MPEDWAEAFARHGFYRDVDYDASFVTSGRCGSPGARAGASARARIRAALLALRAAEQDARGYAVEVQTRLAEAERERDRLAGFEKELAAQHIENADLKADSHELKIKLGAALDTIRHMEASIFWRLRRLVNRVLGKGRDG